MTVTRGGRPAVARAAGALLAALLVGASLHLPLWSMSLKAPQYPKGLHLKAYGAGLEGDLYEINIINHYIGMQPIDPRPELETKLFPVGVWLLAGLALVAPLHRHLLRLAVAALLLVPAGILVDLQWWLHRFGHDLDPTAPMRQPPFTPLVIGVSRVGNFETVAIVSTGFLCLIGAAGVLIGSARLARRLDRSVATAMRRTAAAAAIGLASLLQPAQGTAQEVERLQARIDAAPAGSTVTVRGGVHQGPIVVRGPLTLVGVQGAVIDGNGRGSVVTLEGRDVVFRGFAIRNSGRDVTEEAAGIKAAGDGHVIEDNVIDDVYFGIHLSNGRQLRVSRNRVTPGLARGARPGHGISLWYVRDSRLADNRIASARDGIYLSFTDSVDVSGNQITDSRYGVHSMYSSNARLQHNTIRSNLLGVALMFSDRVVLEANVIADHRTGAAAFGVLLKDIGDLTLAQNRIVRNRAGIHAEGVSMAAGEQAAIRGNLIAGNDVGLALQSNVALTIAGNRIADNLTDVSALGSRLSTATRWAAGRRGNYWSQYRGYDRDGDGIGDVPHRASSVMDDLLRRSPLARAFLYTPAHAALEAAVRLFPLYRPAPLLSDEFPLVRPGATEAP